MSSVPMNFRKSFRHTHAVDRLNLEIPEGSIFALHASFVPQRHHGIHFRCSPRGDIASQHRYRDQHK